MNEEALCTLRYVTNSEKIHHQGSFGDIFSNPCCLCAVSMWIFFSSLLLCELVHDKI